MSANRERDLEELELELRTLQTDSQRAHGNFESAVEGYHQFVQDMTTRYEALLRNYIHMKKETSNAHGDNQGGGNQETYVLVLVDGNSVNFKNDLIRANGNGGNEAALRLYEAIKGYITDRNTIPDDSRVIIRVYADLKSLSMAAWNAKLVDLNSQPRVLAPFASRFSQTSTFTDFIDCGVKNMVMDKTHEFFKLAVKDPKYKMIFFAVGAAPTYLSMLTRNEGNTSKIVLIRTGQVNPKYLRLGLRTIEISNVFHQDIGRNSISYLRASLNGTDMISQDQGRVMIHGHGNKSRTNTHFDGKPVCRHHREKGHCKYKNCKFAHPFNPEQDVMASFGAGASTGTTEETGPGELSSEDKGYVGRPHTIETVSVMKPLIDI